MAEDMTTLSVRIPSEWVKRIDALVPKIEVSSEAIKISRSTAIRNLILAGLEELENPKPKSEGIWAHVALWRGSEEHSTGWVASDSMSSLQKLIEALKLPEPQIFHRATIAPEIKDIRKLMETC